MGTSKYFKAFHKVRLLTLIVLISFSINLQSCDEFENLSKSNSLTEEDVAEGLKEALKVGIDNSVKETNRKNGYYGNSLIKIPWPEEAQGAYDFIDNNLDFLSPLLDTVVLRMNRGAEKASEKALPIFLDAITSITIQDAWDILKGNDDAATMYLKDRTYNSLSDEFKPDIHDALESVGAASAWNEITTQYNDIVQSPLINREPINTDLAEYTTIKALDGLFFLVSEEENKIRTDPRARVNDILERVFGELD